MVANIRRAGAIAAGFKLRLALEYQFQHPVVKSVDILRDLIAKAGEKSVGLLLDAYHLQRGGRPGAGFSDVPEAEIFYVQYSDVPDAPPNGPPPSPAAARVVRWTEPFQLLAAKNYTGYSVRAQPVQWERAPPMLHRRCGATRMRSPRLSR